MGGAARRRVSTVIADIHPLNTTITRLVISLSTVTAAKRRHPPPPFHHTTAGVSSTASSSPRSDTPPHGRFPCSPPQAPKAAWYFFALITPPPPAPCALLARARHRATAPTAPALTPFTHALPTTGPCGDRSTTNTPPRGKQEEKRAGEAVYTIAAKPLAPRPCKSRAARRRRRPQAGGGGKRKRQERGGQQYTMARRRVGG